MNRLVQLDSDIRAKGVVTVSAGNHSLGVAQGAKLLGCSATVFVPVDASPLEVSKLRQLGVTLRQEGRDYDAVEALAQAYADAKSLSSIHGFPQPEMIAGQGTIGLELLKEIPNSDGPLCVLIPVGGGGLLAAILENKVQFRGMPIVLIISGGNVADEFFYNKITTKSA